MNTIEKSNFKKIEKGISIISDIGEKIVKLNEISSKDFLFLNKLQKKYYGNIKIISDKLSLIDRTTADGKMQIEINDYIILLKQFQKKIGQDKSQVSDLLKSISDVSMGKSSLDISLYSFKQSIITYKLMSTNNLIDLIFEKHPAAINIKSNWADIEKSNYKIEEKCKDLKSDLTKFNNYIEKLRNNSENQITWLGKFEKYISDSIIKLNILKEKLINYQDTSPMLKKDVERTLKNFDNIIINLQYQDIIRQKMEHIHQLLNEINNELDINKKQHSYIDAKQTKTKYLTRISEIAKIQINQLFVINNEFQSATTNIVQKIFDSSEEIYNTLGAFNKFQLTNEINSLQKDTERIDEITIDNKEEMTKVKSTAYVGIIETSMHSIGLNYNEFLNYTEEFVFHTNEIKKKLESNDLNIANLSETAEIIEQESNRVQITLNEIKDVMALIENKTKTIFSFFSNSEDGVINSSKQNIDIIDYNTSFLKLLNEMKNIDDNLITSIDSIKQFESNLKFDQNKIKYFNYYDTNIQEIINSFTEIVDILAREESDKEKENDLEYYEELKKNYTVSKEHEIHDEVLGKDNVPGKSKEQKIDSVPEDDNLELF